MDRITELEGVVLGIVRRLQPCTAYAVRRELTESPSTHWSASAGSIYPLFKRLQSFGLLEATADAQDGRGRRHVRLTESGAGALRAWTLRATDPEVAAAVFDSVRTRAFFIGYLAARDRRRFVKGSLEALEGFLATARGDLAGRDADGDGFARFAALGAVYQAEARVAWMKELLEHVGET